MSPATLVFDSKRKRELASNFEMCCRRMKKISWNVRTKNKAELNAVKEDRNILYITDRRICTWILPKHVIEER